MVFNGRIKQPLQVMDPDHPLAALVRKAQQEKNGNLAIAAKPAEEVAVQAPVAEYSSDPNMAALYYGYCMLPDGTYCLAPPPPGVDASSYYNTLPAGMMAAHSASLAPPPPGTTPPPDLVITAPSAPAAPAAPAAPSVPAVPTAATALVPASASVSHAAPSGFYSTRYVGLTPDSPVLCSSAPQATVSHPPQSSSSSSAAAIIPPPPDIQPVIDKLAEYVARNGAKFESSVRAKNDPRFDFLQSWNQYNTYYEFKKHYFMQKEASNLPQPQGYYERQQSRKGSAVHKDDSTANCSSEKQSNEGKLIKASFAPICFAIKSKENDMLPLEKNRVRLDDDSDEDKGKEEGQEGVEPNMARAEQHSEGPPLPPEEKKPPLSQEELEAKQGAKQKLEDRLAAAAREKLAQASKEWKEKQLQAERKRKAALFLQTLRAHLTKEVTVSGYTMQKFRYDDSPNERAIGQRSMEKLSEMPDVSTVPDGPVLQMPLSEYPPPDPSVKSVHPPATILPLSSSSTSCSTARERDRNRERDKKKKKHKRRSRSRSRSKSKTKHSLPSAYRSYKRSSSLQIPKGISYRKGCNVAFFAFSQAFNCGKSVERSQSHSPNKRERRRDEKERERDRYGGSNYRHANSPGLGRKRSRSRSRSPRERRKKKSSKSVHHSKTSSKSPDRGRANRKVSAHTANSSPTSSPTSSLRSSRDASQEKDKQVSSTIISSVQNKITQSMDMGYICGRMLRREEKRKAMEEDLMAKVRAMLAKGLQPNPS
ncbi:splicing factor, suppressor of white-apricot-like isoform X1 [Silurus asotus]|uniref:Splicing factor, suppressor of white-apricot homolog n=1 Tax=Silurus asotus TaxID=30991 RepID=A0AAD5AA12_SILAS|nr:splicing factor, suppressor of white-apricot-like isoform X1 [Silurus asotus]